MLAWLYVMPECPTAAPLVMELELVEPSLFLLQSLPALERLVAGIRRRLDALSSHQPM